MDIDLDSEPLGTDPDGEPVFLERHLAVAEEVQTGVASSVAADMFTTDYADVFNGDDNWRASTSERRHVRLGRRLDLRRPAALLRRHAAGPPR